MEQYRVTIENYVEDSEEDEMKWWTLKFYSNDIMFGQFLLVVENIGEWRDNLSYDDRFQKLVSFIDNINNDINDTLYFRQTNGQIKIVFINNMITFHVSGEIYECEFTVYKNQNIMTVFNVMRN